MFDIGFAEILLISIVALLILGPDKLPHAVRTAALWIGRARRSFNQVRGEIEQQLNADDIRRQLHNESILKDLREAKKKAGKLTEDTRESINSLKHDIEDGASIADPKRASKESRDEDSPEAEGQADTGQRDDADSNAGATADEERAPARDAEDAPHDANDQATDAEPEKKAEKPPIEDFYNNPSERVVTIKQGRMSAGESPQDRNKNKDQTDSGQDEHDRH